MSDQEIKELREWTPKLTRCMTPIYYVEGLFYVYEKGYLEAHPDLLKPGNEVRAEIVMSILASQIGRLEEAKALRDANDAIDSIKETSRSAWPLEGEGEI